MTAENHPTRACIHADRLAHNLRLLQQHAGPRPMWPAIKANAYGHDSVMIARCLAELGFDTLCVAHVSEAAELIDAGVGARFLLLSAALPEQAAAIVDLGCEPALCTKEMAQALAGAAQRSGREVAVHVMVDTGMGRIGITPDKTESFLRYCRSLPGLRLRGLMSHFPRADEADKTYSHRQIERFRDLLPLASAFAIEFCHIANSAAILDLPEAHFDAVRPGIAIYGLRPSAGIVNPAADQLQPVLEWKTRITQLKEVPAGVGLSYGHSYRTTRPSLIATVPVGYGDGLSRQLSNRLEMLVGGARCAQVGRITMDQSLLDVTALRDKVNLGDEVVIIGRQRDEAIRADELAQLLDTINYEIVTAIARRVPRVRMSGAGIEGR